jgi:hypothetical protein
MSELTRELEHDGLRCIEERINAAALSSTVDPTSDANERLDKNFAELTPFRRNRKLPPERSENFSVSFQQQLATISSTSGSSRGQPHMESHISERSGMTKAGRKSRYMLLASSVVFSKYPTLEAF